MHPTQPWDVQKLHERRNTKLPPYLKLFCDWVVHPKLTDKRWAERCVEMVKGTSDPVLEFEKALAFVLHAEKLPEPDWTVAQPLLLGVLKDCPLEVATTPITLWIEPLPGCPGGWALKFGPLRSSGHAAAASVR